MDITHALALLGGISPQQFMTRYWQKKPLLVRQAIPGFEALLDRSELFDLAGDEAVESRLIVHGKKGWQFRHGPLARRSLPPLKTPGWTLLVQGVDLHHDGVHDLLQQFRFVPEARLDDLMISYDVFLLQAHGQRRWQIGRQQDLSLVEGVPLKILSHFVPEQEFVLNPGDLLYLPPRYAHDGVAAGECMTYSIGFRSPSGAELARELLQRMAEEADEAAGDALYRDPRQPAVAAPGAVPADLQAFAQRALQAVLGDPDALPCALGEYLTEPKANVWFEAADGPPPMRRVVLDRRTRMMHDARHIFINGESYRAAGRDATLMRRLADRRCLEAADLARASDGARALLSSWWEAGWLHERSEGVA